MYFPRPPPPYRGLPCSFSLHPPTTLTIDSSLYCRSGTSSRHPTLPYLLLLPVPVPLPRAPDPPGEPPRKNPRRRRPHPGADHPVPQRRHRHRHRQRDGDERQQRHKQHHRRQTDERSRGGFELSTPARVQGATSREPSPVRWKALWRGCFVGKAHDRRRMFLFSSMGVFGWIRE